MGLLFWKGIENAGFRERADGGWDYFPKGVWGHGYRVTAPPALPRARRAHGQGVRRKRVSPQPPFSAMVCAWQLR